jgi:hypothetical protein
MITFTQLGKYGRLGNQLFQYAALRGIALEKNLEAKIPDFNNFHWHGQNCVLNNFNLSLEKYTQKDINKLKYRYTERNWEGLDDISIIKDNTDLFGFFQNIKYFEKYENEIKNDFSIKENIQETSKKYIKSLKSQHNNDIISLHIRRGDVTDGTNKLYGGIERYIGKDGRLEKTSVLGKYIEDAKKLFEGCKFLVFSGGSRKGNDFNQSDIEWCKENLIGDEFIFHEGGSEIQDFCTISNCDGNIITPQSTFGWWAAYLNKNNNVVVPKYFWLSPEYKKLEKKGFYPNNWKII